MAKNLTVGDCFREAESLLGIPASEDHVDLTRDMLTTTFGRNGTDLLGMLAPLAHGGSPSSVVGPPPDALIHLALRRPNPDQISAVADRMTHASVIECIRETLGRDRTRLMLPGEAERVRAALDKLLSSPSDAATRGRLLATDRQVGVTGALGRAGKKELKRRYDETRRKLGPLLMVLAEYSQR